MNKIGKFAKNSMIYFIGQIATKMISFFLLPLYSNKFSTEEYGYFDYSSSILLVIVSLVYFEIWSCILRFVFDYKKQEDKYKVITNGVSLCAVSFVIYTIGFWCINYNFKILYAPYIYIYGVIIMLQNLYCALVRALEKNLVYMISGVVSSTAIIMTNIILIIGFHMSIETLYISGIVGGILQVTILEATVKMLGHFRISSIDKKLLKKMFRFSAPLCVNTIAFWALNSYGRYPISKYLGMDQNGIYAMASRFAVVLSLFVSVFQLAWQELTYSIGNDEGREQYYSKGMELLMRFLGCGMLMLIPFTKLAFTLINTNYKPALAIIPMFYLATLASALSSFLGNIFGAEKRNSIVMYSTLIAAAVNVAVIELTIRKIGLHGVTLALLLGFLVDNTIRFTVLHKLVGLRIKMSAIISIIVLYIITTIVFYKTGIIENTIWLFVLGFIFLYMFRDIIGMFLTKGKEWILTRKK